MGNMFGRSNRAAQAKIYAEIIIAIYMLRKLRHTPSPPPSNEEISDETRVTQPLSYWAKLQSWITRANLTIGKYTPMQVVLGTLIVHHIWGHLSLLTGLNAPYASLYTEPDMHYTKSFASVRYLLTSLDAAVLSTQRVRFAWLRHTLTAILAIYYLIRPRKAEYKVQDFRRSVNVEQVRLCWEKGEIPPLQLVERIMRIRITIDFEPVYIRCYKHENEFQTIEARLAWEDQLKRAGKDPYAPQIDPDIDGDGTIECRLFYNGTREQLKLETKMVLDTPGGGFVSQSPKHHRVYLAEWAKKLGVPVLSVNYRKAPEYPYPCGIHDCWDVYRRIESSNGRVLGMNMTSHDTTTEKPILIAIAGDSAGGNLAAVVTLKALYQGIRPPDGVHLIYPVLDSSADVWYPQGQKRNEWEGREPHVDGSTEDALAFTHVPKIRRRKSSTSPPKTPTDLSPVLGPSIPTSQPTPTYISTSPVSSTSKHKKCRHEDPALEQGPRFTSRALYAFDGVLPIKFVIMLGAAYFRCGGDPLTEICASPILAGRDILSHFPPLYIHVGGVDPLRDDSVRFCHRVRAANKKQTVKLKIIPGVSHAYMQVTSLLPEGRAAVALSTEWLAEILKIELHPGTPTSPASPPATDQEVTTTKSSSSTTTTTTTTTTTSSEKIATAAQNIKDHAATDIIEAAAVVSTDGAVLASSSSSLSSTSTSCSSSLPSRL